MQSIRAFARTYLVRNIDIGGTGGRPFYKYRVPTPPKRLESIGAIIGVSTTVHPLIRPLVLFTHRPVVLGPPHSCPASKHRSGQPPRATGHPASQPQSQAANQPARQAARLTQYSPSVFAPPSSLPDRQSSLLLRRWGGSAGRTLPPSRRLLSE